jgi:hypothetical protein
MITKIADGAYFVPSYSEQTITLAYTIETTVQGFGGTVPFDEGTPIDQESLPPQQPASPPKSCP